MQEFKNIGQGMSEAHHPKDWAAWSREAVENMLARNQEWPAQFGLHPPLTCRWDLERALLAFEAPLHEVIASACLVGTSSEKEGSFVWSWANEAIPMQHGQALEVVHDFGRENKLALLTTPRLQGGEPVGMECLAIAAHLQRAVGTYVERQGDVALYFTLLHLQVSVPDDQPPQ